MTRGEERIERERMLLRGSKMTGSNILVTTSIRAE
jgi:hypothetical protein